MNRAAHRIGRVALAASAALTMSQASAQPFTFSKVADSKTLIPDGSGQTFDGFQSGFGAAAMGGGRISFIGKSKANIPGVYESEGSALAVVANISTPLPGSLSTFSAFGGVHASAQGAMFVGGGPGRGGLYGKFGSQIVPILDTLTPAPGGPISGGIDAFWQEGQNATVLARPVATLKSTVYRVSNGSVGVIADTSTIVPDGTGVFAEFADPRLSNGATSLLGRDSADKWGIYRHDGVGLSMLLNTNSNALPGQGKFTSFGQLSADGSDFAFAGAVSTGGVGVYSQVGGSLNQIARLGQVMPGGATLSGLSLVTLDGGSVVFYDPTASVIYTDFDGVLRRLIGSGDTLDGKTVSFVNMFPAGRDGNKVAFNVIFSGNSPISPDTALYVATLPAPGGVAVVGMGLLLATRRRRSN